MKTDDYLAAPRERLDRLPPWVRAGMTQGVCLECGYEVWWHAASFVAARDAYREAGVELRIVCEPCGEAAAVATGLLIVPVTCLPPGNHQEVN